MACSDSVFDVILIGLGVMGSATAFSLAQRGDCSVLGLEQFEPGHCRGSSHGETRIFRRSLSDPEIYGDLLELAYEKWKLLERVSGQQLFYPVGTLVVGSPDGGLLQESLVNAHCMGLKGRLLTATELRKSFPNFALRDGEAAFREDDAGYLLSDSCLTVMRAGAVKGGVSLKYSERVLHWCQLSGGGIEVQTSRGLYRTHKLIITAGPWLKELVPRIGDEFRVERQCVVWYPKPDEGLLSPFDWEIGERQFLYGIPSPSGMKIGFEKLGETVDATVEQSDVKASERAAIRELLIPRIPLLAGLKETKATPCLYSRSKSELFAIGFHPSEGDVILAGAFQGVGFKFATGVGEVLADLALTGESRISIERFGPESDDLCHRQ